MSVELRGYPVHVSTIFYVDTMVLDWRRHCQMGWPDAYKTSGQGAFQEVALSDAAAWLTLPRSWGLTQPSGAMGGAHAGYRVYPCKGGRLALAALELHFAAALCQVVGVQMQGMGTMFKPATHAAVAQFLARANAGTAGQTGDETRPAIAHLGVKAGAGSQGGRLA